MSSSFVTQCPHCHTGFRVNHAQLSAANGAVRCGACMHVFDAARHLIADQPVALSAGAAAAASTLNATAATAATDMPPAPSKPFTSGTPAGKTASDTLWIHDDLDIDDLDLDEELARLEREEMKISSDFLALEKAAAPAQELLNAPLSEHEPLDERWAQALLNENSSAEASLQPLPSAETHDSLAGERRTNAHLRGPRASLLSSNRSVLSAQPDDADDLPLGDLQAETPQAPHKHAEPSFSSAALQLQDEPIPLDWQPRRKPRSRWLLWSLLNLLALAALVGQYAHRNFDELARQDQYRTFFAQLCPTLGCTLPSKVDVSQIRSSNLMVRAHPEFAGALVVDAIIYNRAPFAQPFPLLEMRFANLQGQTLASRRFTPAEYLAGELAGQTEMPSQTPIRIALEILDPGSNAENYSLRFLSPE